MTAEEGEVELKVSQDLSTENNQKSRQQLTEKVQQKKRPRKKVTRKAILSMLQSDHITPEECQQEIKKLDARAGERKGPQGHTSTSRSNSKKPANTSRKEVLIQQVTHEEAKATDANQIAEEARSAKSALSKGCPKKNVD